MADRPASGGRGWLDRPAEPFQRSAHVTLPQRRVRGQRRRCRRSSTRTRCPVTPLIAPAGSAVRDYAGRDGPITPLAEHRNGRSWTIQRTVHLATRGCISDSSACRAQPRGSAPPSGATRTSPARFRSWSGTHSPVAPGPAGRPLLRWSSRNGHELSDETPSRIHEAPVVSSARWRRPKASALNQPGADAEASRSRRRRW
jgi:hypothetical protein